MTFQYLDTHLAELNFTTRDRLDPLIIYAFRLFAIEQTQASYVYLQLAIILCGLLYLLRVLGIKINQGGIAGLSCIAALVFVLGLEPVYLKFHWFPFLLGSFIALRRCPSTNTYLITTIAALEWSLTAGSFGVFGTLLGLILSRPGIMLPQKVNNAVANKQHTLCFQGIGAATLVLSYILMPVYPMPDYPAAARVVPVSPFTFLFHPLIGPTIEPNPLRYQAVVENLWTYITRLLILCLGSAVIAFFAQTKRGTLYPLLLWATLIIVPLLEIITPPEFLPYTPFQTLCRIIPGIALTPLVWCILPFGMICLFATNAVTTFLQGNGLKHTSLMLIFCLAILTIDTTVPQLRIWNALIPCQDHFLRYLATQQGTWLEKLKESPSGYIVEHHGDWTGAQGLQNERNTTNLEPLANINWIPQASLLNTEAALAIDGRTDTRWKTGRPQQPGDFFLLTLPQPSPVIKAVLSIPNEPTDFPKGIEVQGSLNGKEFWTILSELPWPGPLRWTAGNYPYYGFQANVVLEFSKEEHIKYVKFIQTGQEDYYDWSIDEIMLYRKR